jgi:zinc protease
MAEGEVFDPSPANIDSRTRTVTTFAERDEAHDAAEKDARRRGRSRQWSRCTSAMRRASSGKRRRLQFAGAMLMRGTTTHTRQQLQDELDKLKAQMNAGASMIDADLTVNTVQASLPAALKLGAEVLRHPGVPRIGLRANPAGLARENREPQRAGGPGAECAVSRHFSLSGGRSARRSNVPGEYRRDQKMTLADTKKFYSDFFGASNAEIAIVGDFDPRRSAASWKQNSVAGKARSPTRW